jgi:ferritin
MSAFFERIGLKGFANWMRVQAREELMHAMKIYDYVHERGGRVKLSSIEQPPSEWKTPLDAFNAVLNHERKVTSMINELVDIALEERDHATYTMLQWFVMEQVEEEASAKDLVERLSLVGDDKGALISLDLELAKRQFVEENE